MKRMNRRNNGPGEPQPAQLPQCRFCLDSEGQAEMIAPCNCSGSIQMVHRYCLDQWRTTGFSTSNLTHCPVCKFEYVLENVGDGRVNSIVAKVAWVLLGYFLMLAFGTFCCGYLVKLALSYGWMGYGGGRAVAWVPESRRMLLDWVHTHFFAGFMCFFAFIGTYAVIKGFIIWVTSRADRAERRGNNRRREAQQQFGEHPDNNLDDLNDDDHNNNDHNDTPTPVNVGSSGRNGGGGSDSGGNKSNLCDCNDSDSNGKSCGKILLGILIVIGIFYVLYVVFMSVTATIQAENKNVRKSLAKQMRVVDLRAMAQ